MAVTLLSGKLDKQYGDVVAFIKEHMKLAGDKDGPRYQVNQEHFNEFLANNGITKDTIKQISDAQVLYNNGTVAVLKELLVDDPKAARAMINTRTHGGVVSTRMTRQVDTRTPVTGEPLTRFGVVTIKMNLKSRMDKELLEACADEISNSVK